MNNIGRRVTSQRTGTVLIIVAGLSALMASLAVVFLTRMQSDAQESLLTVRDAQARIMLVAACQYIQEASRIGYDDSNNHYHKEAYGWIDVRDGAVGPKPSSAMNGAAPDLYGSAGYGVNDDSFFPVQTARSFPLHAVARPPYAISPAVAPNPIDPDPAPNANGVPWLVEPDPQLPKQLTSSNFQQWESGDMTPRVSSVGRSWFRLMRCGYKAGGMDHLSRYNAATFIVTVGAGGTQGYRSRDWATMSAAERALFNDDQTQLATLEADELRYWYLVEWSPAIGDMMMNAIANRQEHNTVFRNPTKPPPNNAMGLANYASQQPNWTFGDRSSPLKSRNFGGTISYVQRLLQEPPDW